VLFGNELIKRVPLDVVRMIAAALLVATGVWLFVQTLGLW
jgi:Ca2+/H+ antiporter, TMEM165/GDT1 family